MQEPATFSDVEADILDMASDGPAQSKASLVQWYSEFQGRLEDVGAHHIYPHPDPCASFQGSLSVQYLGGDALVATTALSAL